MKHHWKDLLSRECGLSQSQLSNKHQPCPICGGEDRYRFDDSNGDGNWYCNQGHNGKTSGDGFAFLQLNKGIDFKEALAIVKKYLDLPDRKEQKLEKLGGLSLDFKIPAPELH